MLTVNDAILSFGAPEAREYRHMLQAFETVFDERILTALPETILCWSPLVSAIPVLPGLWVRTFVWLTYRTISMRVTFG